MGTSNSTRLNRRFKNSRDSKWETSYTFFL